ncbi:MAG: hypothetical protein JSV38_06890 [Desulfobacterales bacterium]|nr:MAG: hypothetical protein JSV38_06890 [Desulfobacterales bacterium]
MPKYVHQKKKMHISRFRRKGDDTSRKSEKDKAKTDRRREKKRVGIIIQDHDRRKKEDPKYDDAEKRSGEDRRSGKDRRE